MKQVWHHFTKCEEFYPDNGMWRSVQGFATREGFIKAAASLMQDFSIFKAAMTRAIYEWPNSCEMNMTSQSTNHRAWFGHAGCFLATGSPEDCTRLGWHTLTEDEQRLANLAAEQVIEEWRKRYDLDNLPLSLFNA